MDKENLGSNELLAAFVAEQKYLVNLKESWLKSFDKGESYSLYEVYEDQFGFGSAESLATWQANTLHILERKPEHLSAIKYLKLCGDSTEFNEVIFSHSTMVESHYAIRRTSDSSQVALRCTSEEFLVRLQMDEMIHTVVLFLNEDRMIANTQSMPVIEMQYEIKSTNLALAISDGFSVLQIDKDIQGEIISIVLDFTESRRLTSETFKPIHTKRGIIQ